MKRSYSATIKYPSFSINKAWQGKRFKTKEYGLWRMGLMNVLKDKLSFSVEGFVKLEINYFIKEFARTDVDNLVKGFVDGLVDAGIIEDDRKVVHYNIWKHKAEGEEKIKFKVKRNGYQNRKENMYKKENM